MLSSTPRRPWFIAAAVLYIATGCSTEPGPPAEKISSVEVSPKVARIWIVGDSVKFAAAVYTETNGFTEGIPVTWVARDPLLVRISSTGVVTSLKKGGSTYVVATAGDKKDSALVEVPTTPCAGVAPTPMAVGQVVTGIGASGFCAAKTADAEYRVVAFNSSLTAGATVVIEMIGQGLGDPATLGGALASRAAFIRPSGLHLPRARDVRGEVAFREAESAMLAPRVAAAREWYRSRSRAALRVAAVPAVGDVISVNASMSTSSSCPSEPHDARVAAVSASAIILDDVGNPSGGFTKAEYASIAATFDTLINPLDVATFGAPTDLDNNGRVIILFTRAINALTAPGSVTYVGGRTMQRDLFPKTGTGDNTHPRGCAGSNVGEMFYMAVPDPAGSINGNTDFTKEFVAGQTPVTIAHEYQHLINYSRRMYLLGLTSDRWTEEIWLHEGLSHVAEELLFHRVSGLPTRTNIGLDDIISSDRTLDAFDNIMAGDFFLYDAYAGLAAMSSPYRQTDDVTTRGGTWAFLRYAMDQQGASDGDFLYRLVNSGLIGLTNLQTQLGVTSVGLQDIFRDFTISVYADGRVTGLDRKYTQPSWDMRSIYPGYDDPSFTFPLVSKLLADNAPQAVALIAGGFTVYRFIAVPGTDALVRATGSSGSAMPPSITLSVIRIQ